MVQKKLGIVGGSFDPIHNGHLRIAQAIQDTLGLDEVLFVPAYISPFKQWRAHASGEDRYAMVKLAIKDNPTWQASDMELTRTGISYTYDTIASLKKLHGDQCQLFFVIGADSALELDKWYRIKDALDICTFVVAARPGFSQDADAVKQRLTQAGLTNLLWVKTPEIAISSTEIREKIIKKLSVAGLMPPAVVEYIEQRDLYQA